MKKILVAEDDRFLAKAYKFKLTKKGYEVVIVRDGKEVIEALKTFTPDLIILDLMMPNMNGFEVLEHLRQNEKLGKIPVVVASNLSQEGDVNEAMKLGAKDYIIKTDFNTNELIDKINSYIK